MENQIKSVDAPQANECAWCFNKFRVKRYFAFGFIFCSPECAYRHKEFEGQFKKN